MEGKVRTYMVSGKELIEDEVSFNEVVQMVVYATMKGVRDAEKMIEGWISAGRRIIYFYPGLSGGDVSRFEYIGDVPDGAMYLG